MNSRFQMRCRRLSAAFSLVEVLLAVAVIAIGLLAVIGLFPQGLQSARDAADNTLSATILQGTISLIRASPFDKVIACDFCTTRNLNTYNQTDTIYFDQQGLELDPTPITVSTAGYYRVDVRYTSQSPLVSSVVIARVYWPAYQSVPPANVNTLYTNTFITEVAWYNSP